jgi:hypothetical protein
MTLSRLPQSNGAREIISASYVHCKASLNKSRSQATGKSSLRGTRLAANGLQIASAALQT